MNKFNILISGIFMVTSIGAIEIKPITPTNSVEIRKAFFALHRPLEYRMHDKSESHFISRQISLYGEAKRFAEKFSAEEIIYALWPLLDDRETEADAAIFLIGAYGRRDGGLAMFTYRTPRQPGNWIYGRGHALSFARACSQQKLRKESYWYPHVSYFDDQAVVRDSHDNPARRLEYIEAIVKILADPAIRKENPLEVKNLLMILSFLKASEAVPTFVDYMFFDWSTGSDYRIQEGDTDREKTGRLHNIFSTVLPYRRLADFGEKFVPDALERLANASRQERKTTVGGGGTPIHAITYFIQLPITADEALVRVRNYKRDHPQLNDEQKAALDEIILFIEERRFCPEEAINSDYPSIRTWAPSYGKEQPVKK